MKEFLGTLMFYLGFLLVMIFSVQLADLFLVDVLKLDIETNILWLPVIMGLGPGLILTIGYSKSLYGGDNFIKKTNRLGGGYTAGGRAISDIFQLILELIISKKAIVKAKGNLKYSVYYGLVISLVEIAIVSLMLIAVIKIVGIGND